MNENSKAVLLLEDGTTFYGKPIGKPGRTTGELVFNTGMSGYQEVFTDPSNHGQIIVMSTSHIGNYGVTSSDSEINQIQCSGIVVKEFSEIISRKLADSSLNELMNNSKKIGICEIDTRNLVKHLRDNGTMNAILSTEDGVSIEELKEELKKVPSMKGLALANKVTIEDPITFQSSTEETKYQIAVIDYGSMRNVVRFLNNRKCEVKVFPMTASFQEIMKYNPDGIVLSAGPGDPNAMEESINLVKQFIDSGTPIFGINLGHQLVALSQGLVVEKMLNGHRGVNHPVINHKTAKLEITSQNHGFVVTRESAEANPNIEITHSHLNDNTVAGIAIKGKPVFSVQYQPEQSVGPHDSGYLLEDFLNILN
ncbi:MAG: glutamine-hydrolyzing carbamoyl-phosphate synthase small subunit [Brumimicrobium sp.]